MQKWIINVSSERIAEINQMHVERFGLTSWWHIGFPHPSNGSKAMPVHDDILLTLTSEEQAGAVSSLPSDWILDPLT